MRGPAGCRTAQCHGESWLTHCFAGLSPNACPDMVLGYPFLENSEPHFGLSVVERPGKMCLVPPPNGCSESRQSSSCCCFLSCTLQPLSAHPTSFERPREQSEERSFPEAGLRLRLSRLLKLRSVFFVISCLFPCD